MTAVDAGPDPLLTAYRERIGMPAADEPDLATLRRIVEAHATTIAFENLDPFTGVEPALNAAALTDKLVRGGRGGWCFEHNGLLRRNLDALGYRTTGLAARVLWGVPDGAPPTGRIHMLLRVDLPEGAFVVDVGFGGTTPTGVLALQPDLEQPTPLEPFRLRRDGDVWTVQARAGDWGPLYTFDLVAAAQADYDIGNWYLVHHPSSFFRSTLVIARPLADRRLAMSGRTFTVHHLGGPSERRELASPAEIRGVLESEFGIDTGAVTGLDRRLGEMLAG